MAWDSQPRVYLADESKPTRSRKVAMIKYAAGAVLSNLFPLKRMQIENGFTMPYFAHESNPGIIARLIRSYIGQRGQHDPKKLETLHKRFWREQRPQDWFDATSDRLNRIYIPTFELLVQETHLDLISNQIETIVEFGAGNGDWLAYLKSKWNGPKRFLGIDLANEQIAINRQRHADLEFQASDLTEWVSENKSRRSLFLTNCGVLEYLSEATLHQLLKTIRSNHLESMVLFVEPIAADFDLELETSSRLHGSEFSFSHNYPNMLKNTGFEILRTSTYPVEDFQMLSTLAKSNAI